MTSRPEPAAVGDGPETLSPPIRCQLRGKVDEDTERLALGVLTPARLLGLAAGTHLGQL